MANALVKGSLFAVGLVGVLCASVLQAGDADTYVIDGSQAAQLDSCVEPTDFMRRNHMEVIKHQRDETVHNGIRSTKHSLAGCIECHVSYGADEDPVPVNDEGQFCIACHQFAAVGMNCFGCHASVPKSPVEAAAGTAGHGGLSWNPVFAMAIGQTEGVTPEASEEGERP